MERNAKAVWQGRIRDGTGKITTESGALTNAEYSFATRFGAAEGTNPEELIAAAHAACFTMAFSAELEKLGMVPEVITTSASVVLEKDAQSWTVAAVHLDSKAIVPGADHGMFQRAADSAKVGCPISRLLKAPISLEAKLVEQVAAQKKAG